MGEKDHPADHFARALGEWMGAMKLEPADCLGRIYEEQAVANSYSGQFFTPDPLVEMMAVMTMPDTLSDEALVNDPACGSGRMLIAGIQRNRFATFVGVDIDLTCVHMTALNCLVRKANTWIIHGNRLSLEARGGYHVRRSPFGGELFRLDQATAEHNLQLPLRRTEASTALLSAPTRLPADPTVAEPKPGIRKMLAEASQQFTTDPKGQRGFGF